MSQYKAIHGRINLVVQAIAFGKRLLGSMPITGANTHNRAIIITNIKYFNWFILSKQRLVFECNLIAIKLHSVLDKFTLCFFQFVIQSN